jgi:hypothetical protein
VAGVPARTLRQRFAPPLIEAIEASRWWELDLAGLRGLVRRNRNAVYAPTVAALDAEFSR